MDPRSIGVRCGSTAFLPLVGKAGVQSSAGGISPACPARSLPCAWCMHGRAFRSSLSSPCRSSSVLSVVVFLRGTPRFFGGFRDRGLRASLFIGRLVGISCCCLGRGATGVAVIESISCMPPGSPKPENIENRVWRFRGLWTACSTAMVIPLGTPGWYIHFAWPCMYFSVQRCLRELHIAP